MNWIAKRLNEPSTWGGLVALALAGEKIAADPRNPVAWFAALGGLAAAVKAEKGGA